MKQAEFYLGEDKFQTAVRAFLKKHEFANAEWTDLVKEFETASKQDLKDWSENWVTKRGMPIFRFERTEMTGPDRRFVSFNQTNSLKEEIYWQQKVKLFYIDVLNSRRNQDFVLSSKSNSAEIDSTLNFAKFIFPNYQDYGYGIFLLDEKSRAYVLENIQTEKDDFLRSMMWGSLWDAVRFYELAPEDYVKLVIKVLSSDFSRQTAGEKSTKDKNPKADEKPPKGGTQNFSETDESTIVSFLSRVSTAMNYYLTDAQAKQFAPEIEKLLLNRKCVGHLKLPDSRLHFIALCSMPLQPTRQRNY